MELPMMEPPLVDPDMDSDVVRVRSRGGLAKLKLIIRLGSEEKECSPRVETLLE
jgi:hypothetical protein